MDQEENTDYFRHSLYDDNEILHYYDSDLFTELGQPTTATTTTVIDLNIDMHELSQKLYDYLKPLGYVEFSESAHSEHASFPIVAINSNFVNIGLPEYRDFIKHSPTTAHKRIMQGNGLCFNASIEFHVLCGELYKPKLFPLNGKIQLSGAKNEDFSDSLECNKHIINLLSLVLERPINIINNTITLVNYKYYIKRVSPRILVDFASLQELLLRMEKKIIDVPFTVDVTVNRDNNKLQFKINNKTTVKMQLCGKINISSNDPSEAAQVHALIKNLFTQHQLLALEPLTDDKFEEMQQIKRAVDVALSKLNL